MSNEPKHTETPWKVVEHNDKNETDIISDEYFIAQAKHYSDDDITFERLVMIESKVKRVKDTNQSTGRANAARIVQCVNEYDGLIETIKSLRAEHAELIEALSATLPILNDVVHEQIDWVRIIVRTTLAKYEKP